MLIVIDNFIDNSSSSDESRKITLRNPEWSLQKELEKKLGYKIIDWVDGSGVNVSGIDNEGGHIENGSIVSLQNLSKYLSSVVGRNDGAWICILGISLMDSSIELRVTDCGGDGGGSRNKGSRDRNGEVIRLVKDRMIIVNHARYELGLDPDRIFSSDDKVRVFSFHTHSRKLSYNYWNLQERQLEHFVRPCFSHDLCDKIIAEAESLQWTKERHKMYATTDIPVKSLPGVRDEINKIVQGSIFKWLQEYFFLNMSDMYLNDLFVIKYSADGQRKLKMHRDVSILSFNILLNFSDEFDGGGTRFYHRPKKVCIDKGEIVMHSGALFHSGEEVIRGNRYIMVGFVGLRGDRVNKKLRAQINKRVVSDEEMLNNMFVH